MKKADQKKTPTPTPSQPTKKRIEDSEIDDNEGPHKTFGNEPPVSEPKDPQEPDAYEMK